MKKSLLIVSILIFGITTAQKNKVLDSLLLALKKGTEQQKIFTLLNISDEYSNFDLNKAIFYAKISLVKSKKLRNDSLVGLSYNAIANNFQYKSEMDSALKYHSKALEIRKKSSDTIGIADTFNNLGIFYDTNGDFPNALKNYFKALNLYDSKQLFAKQAMVYSNIGIVYKAQKEYSKAYQYYKKAYSIYSTTSDKFGITSITTNLGSVLINLKRYKESIYYSSISKKGYKDLGYENYMPYPLSNIACANDSLHNYNLAETDYLKSINLFEKFNNNYQVAEISNLYASCLNKQKKYDQGIVAATKALNFATKANANLLKIAAYENLYKANIGKRNFEKSLFYIKMYNVGRDSLFANEKTKAVFELETKYQTERKEKQLLLTKNKLFKNQVALQKEKLAVQTKNNSIIILLIVFGFLLLVVYGIYRKKQLEQKAFLLAEQSKQRQRVTQAVIEAEEAERKRIASDLHDGVGQLFSAVKMNLNGLLDRIEIKKPDDKFLAEKTMALVDESCKEVRVISHKMMPNFLLKSGIAADIKSFIEKIDENSLKISFESAGFKEQLEFNEEIILYRIIQELINNVIKHAKANELQISLNKTKDNILVKIVDNGIGFDYDKAIEKGGLGLKNILVRIEFLKGKLHFSKNLPTGTSVQIDIPIN